jgi:integrase
MLLPLKCICEGKNARRNGTSIVYIQYCQNSKQKPLLNTGIAIPPQFWNEEQQVIKDSLPQEYGNVSALNQELHRMFRVAEDILSFALNRKLTEPGKFAKETFSASFDPATLADIGKRMDAGNATINKDIFFQIDDYIRTQTKKVCKDMPRIYRNMKEHLKAFEEHRGLPVTFESLDYTFYEEWVDFLSYDYVQRRWKVPVVGLKVNTVGKTIKQFRTFLNNRVKKKIIAPPDLTGWTIPEEEVDAVYLNWEEISKVFRTNLANFPHLVDYRDDTVVGCLTGLRFSDFSKLSETDVRGDLLYKKQQKSSHWVVIPLRPEAKEILDNKFSKGSLPPSNPEFNRHIKNLCKQAGITEPVTHSYKKGNQLITETKPKYAWVTSHTCRRSFCTNEFLAGTPVELIMKISGHKSVKDFYKYIRITPEEAAAKMREIWISRGDRLNLNPLKAA